MIVVTAVVTSNQKNIESLRSAIQVMETASRAEVGCEDYTFSAELGDPDPLRITEKWSDIESLHTHMHTPHMTAFRQAIDDNPPQSLKVNFYHAEELQF